MTMYDWSKFPDWANFGFTDSEGNVWCSDNKPDVGVGINGGFCGDQKDRWEIVYHIGVDLNWRESLQQR